MITMPSRGDFNYYTAQDVASLMGVTVGRVHQISSSDPSFPDSIKVNNRMTLWSKPQVDAYLSPHHSMDEADLLHTGDSYELTSEYIDACRIGHSAIEDVHVRIFTHPSIAHQRVVLLQRLHSDRAAFISGGELLEHLLRRAPVMVDIQSTLFLERSGDRFAVLIVAKDRGGQTGVSPKDDLSAERVNDILGRDIDLYEEFSLTADFLKLRLRQGEREPHHHLVIKADKHGHIALSESILSILDQEHANDLVEASHDRALRNLLSIVHLVNGFSYVETEDLIKRGFNVIEQQSYIIDDPVLKEKVDSHRSGSYDGFDDDLRAFVRDTSPYGHMFGDAPYMKVREVILGGVKASPYGVHDVLGGAEVDARYKLDYIPVSSGMFSDMDGALEGLSSVGYTNIVDVVDASDDVKQIAQNRDSEVLIAEFVRRVQEMQEMYAELVHIALNPATGDAAAVAHSRNGTEVMIKRPVASKQPDGRLRYDEPWPGDISVREVVTLGSFLTLFRDQHGVHRPLPSLESHDSMVVHALGYRGGGPINLMRDIAACIEVTRGVKVNTDPRTSPILDIIEGCSGESDLKLDVDDLLSRKDGVLGA